MSWYISFCCATRNKKTKMLYPLGPFDNKLKYNERGAHEKMNHIRKYIALILSEMLMISLAGCGSSEGVWVDGYHRK